jgi:hypothetical protein
VQIEESVIDAAAETQAMQLLRTEYGRAAITAYIEQWLGESGVCYSRDMHLTNDKAYIMSLLTVLISNEAGAVHAVKELDGYFAEHGYTIPQLQITRKEKKP